MQNNLQWSFALFTLNVLRVDRYFLVTLRWIMHSILQHLPTVCFFLGVAFAVGAGFSFRSWLKDSNHGEAASHSGDARQRSGLARSLSLLVVAGCMLFLSVAIHVGAGVPTLSTSPYTPRVVP
jgi:hypothetical protein